MAIHHFNPDLSEQERKARIRNLLTTTNNDPHVFRVGKNPICRIPLELLSVDDSYQRWDHMKLDVLSKQYDENKTHPIMASYRDGNLYIGDGIHRGKGAMARGYTDIPGVIHTDMTQEDEAQWFAAQNAATVPLSPYDIFRANIVWGEAVDTAIKRVCDNFGLTVMERTKNNYEISAVDACRKIVSSTVVPGEEALTWIFNILYNAKWFEQGNSGPSTKTINGLFRTYTQAHRENDLDGYSDRLITVLRQNSPRGIYSFASMREHHMEHRAAATAVFQDIGAGKVSLYDISSMLTTAGNVSRN